jgi:RND superfamily putative drug exporter
MFIVPALMRLAGDWAWWLPKWLDRLIPNVDVEGAALERRHPHVAPEHMAPQDPSRTVGKDEEVVAGAP